MNLIRIPAPLRTYTEGQKQIEVEAETVGEALSELTTLFPSLKPHLYDEGGAIRQYVNVFVNDADVRGMNAGDTQLEAHDQIMIVPSIAGGTEGEQAVDHSALRTNQAMIIALLLAGFITDASWLAALVGAIMLGGAALKTIGFKPIYRLLQAAGALQPDILRDNPSPHRFSQALGGFVLMAGTLSFALGATATGWLLTWVVILLAGLNLFGGFCVGCAMYYWLNRLDVPGFSHSPPPGVIPGRRPQRTD